MKKDNKKQTYKRREIEIKPLSPNFDLPLRVKRGSIGYDLTCPNDVLVPAHSRVSIPMGFAINLPYGTEGKIEPRSGLSKNGMKGWGRRTVRRKWLGFIPYTRVFQNGMRNYDADVLIGKIDPCYTDEVHVLLKSNDNDAFVIKAGTRIAQLTFYQTGSPFFRIVEELTCKSRGGGLGSSGTERVEQKSEEDPMNDVSLAPQVSSEADVEKYNLNADSSESA